MLAMKPRRSLKTDQSGLAATEFALVLPILSLILFGTVEVSNLLVADARLRTATSSVSDMITQLSVTTVTQNDLNDVNTAVNEIMKPLPVTSGGTALFGVRITTFYTTLVSGVPTTRIRWSRVLPNIADTTTVKATLQNPVCTATETIPTGLASTSNDIVRTTGVYGWRPWFVTVFRFNPLYLKAEYYNMPRYVTGLDMATAAGGNCP